MADEVPAASVNPSEPASSSGVGNLKAPDRQSFLQAMYKEQCDQARQHETMRQQATTIAMTAATVVVSFATASGGALAFIRGTGGLPNVSPLLFALYSLLGLFVIGISRHGRKLSLKHYERNRMHTARAGAYRERLEELFPGYTYGGPLREKAMSTHKERWRKEEAGADAAGVIDQKLYVLWIDLFKFLGWRGVGGFLIVAPLIVVAALLLRHSP
jgi:hypothetical protein